MQRVDSLEKTLMLGGIGGRRRWGRQRMRRLDGITDWMDVSECTLGVGDEQGGLVCWDSWGCDDSDMTEQLNWTESSHLAPSPQVSQPSRTALCLLEIYPRPLYQPSVDPLNTAVPSFSKWAPKISFRKSFLIHHTHILLLCLSTDFNHCICTISHVCALLLIHLCPSWQERHMTNNNNWQLRFIECLPSARHHSRHFNNYKPT